MFLESRNFLVSTEKAGLRIIPHVVVLDTKAFQHHSRIMLRLKLPLLSSTQAEQTLEEHWAEAEERNKSEKNQRKYTNMKKIMEVMKF